MVILLSEPSLVCYCGKWIPPTTPVFPGVRRIQLRNRRWRSSADFLVKCPDGDNELIHAPSTGWCWFSLALERANVYKGRGLRRRLEEAKEERDKDE